ncbi:MAG: hypothetical protein WA890_07295, partial [Micromonospora sp.]
APTRRGTATPEPADTASPAADVLPPATDPSTTNPPMPVGEGTGTGTVGGLPPYIAPTAATAGSAARPRHLAVPDLGRPSGGDTRGPDRPAVDPAGLVGAGSRHSDQAAPDASGPNPAGDADGEETGSGKSRARRGLFRRNRGRGDEETTTDRTDHEPEPVPARDEEYVDWVTGLGRPAETDPEGRPLHTGRHHRD